MSERFPPLEPVTAYAAAAGKQGAPAYWTSSEHDAAFACLVRGISPTAARSASQVAQHVVDICKPIYRERKTSMLDDLAEVWWNAEHGGGVRVRPFSSLPVVDRAELRARVKRLLEERVADTLGDQAVLEGETQRLLDMPETALRRANNDLERRADCERAVWGGAGAAATCAIFAAGRASIAHLGDCRAVRMRRGIVDVLTHEHTLPNRDVITRGIGLWGEGAERVVVSVEAGDVFLFMTRSIYRTLPADVVKAALREGREAASFVVSHAQAPRESDDWCAVAVGIL